MDTALRVSPLAASAVPSRAETRMLTAPSAYEPLYRHTLQQLDWTVTTTGRRFGSTMLLLHRPARTYPPARPLLERRVERALTRIAALEQHPSRVAAATHIAGSTVAFLMLIVAALGLINGQSTLTPILTGGSVWMTATISAPLLRNWRTHRTQFAIATEYEALRTCLRTVTSPYTR
jgi:hypothetical protein